MWVYGKLRIWSRSGSLSANKLQPTKFLKLLRVKLGKDRGQTVLQSHIGVNISSANSGFGVVATFCWSSNGFQGKLPDLVGKGFVSATMSTYAVFPCS
jgi:hypothetical protein